MSRIKLKSLLSLTEQAPQPPMVDPMAVMGSQPTGAQPQGMSAGGQQDQPTPEPTATPETSPEPEDPAEYDFTRDFRAFEDKKNKAEADAKKVLLDKMNKRLLGKTIVANSSRGYGQPKTDYTIKAVKKVSVEFWYKDYVVIASDENDKKYFLTPGINIKIEGSGGEEQPAAQEAPGAGGKEGQPQEEPAGAEQPAPGTVPPAGQEAPNSESPQDAGQPAGQPPQSAPNTAPATPEPEQPQTPAVEDPKKKKKKLPVQPVAENDGEGSEDSSVNTPVSPEIVQQDLGKSFFEFLGKRIDIRPFIKKAVTTGKDNDGMYHTHYTLEIPKQIIGDKFDGREFSLEFRNSQHSSGGPGQAFSRGYVNVISNGRFYTFNFVLTGGMDI